MLGLPAERLSAERALAKERAEYERQQDQDTLLLREAVRYAEMAAEGWVATVAHYTAMMAEERAATERWKEHCIAVLLARSR